MKLRFQLALLVILSIVASLSAAMISTLHLTRVALEKNAQQSAQDAVDEIRRDIETLPPVVDEKIEKELDLALRKHPRVTAVELVLSASGGMSTHINSSRSGGTSQHTAPPTQGPPVSLAPSAAHPAPRTLSATMEKPVRASSRSPRLCRLRAASARASQRHVLARLGRQAVGDAARRDALRGAYRSAGGAALHGPAGGSHPRPSAGEARPGDE